MGMVKHKSAKRPGVPSVWGAMAFVALACGASAPALSEPFVAGTTPNRRPEGAPAISKFERSEAWCATATTGVAQPLPASLKFLDDQGGWFNPFIRPGMTGPYDIRGWHAGAPGKSSQSK